MSSLSLLANLGADKDAGDYKFETLVDDDGTLNSICFVHSKSVELVQRYRYVFILDCTYRTNKFQMPLLHVSGISSTYRTFNAGYVFLR